MLAEMIQILSPEKLSLFPILMNMDSDAISVRNIGIYWSLCSPSDDYSFTMTQSVSPFRLGSSVIWNPSFV